MSPIRNAILLLMICLLGVTARAADTAQPIRAGIIGLDTSHVTAFTKILNDPNATGDLAGIRVVAAYPGGSPDIKSSHDRIEGFTKSIRGMGVEIVDSIPALLGKVDVVLLESVDGRPHLEQVKPVLAAGKPVFIDKPLAGSLADVIAIDELAKKYNVPWFSSSSLRYGQKLEAACKDPKLGRILGAVTWGPCSLEPTHPDLYWYGIHGTELLYTVMGPGCDSVQRTQTKDTEVVTGVWKDGRVGTFRGLRAGKEDYGVIFFGEKAITPLSGFEGYQPLVVEIAKFFKSKKPPISDAETIEIYTFMEAADQSKRQGGASVKLKTVLQKARQEAMQKIGK